MKKTDKRIRQIGGWVRIIMLLACLAALLWLVFFRAEFQMGRGSQEPVGRAEAARQLTLLCAGREACEEAGKESRFSEADQGNWYAKYADYLYGNGLWTEVETPAEAQTLEGHLTYAELWGLLDRLKLSSRWTKRPDSRKGWDREVSEEVWEKVWEEIRPLLDPEGKVEEKTVIFYGTPEQIPELEAWTAATDAGVLGFEGLNLHGCADRQWKILVREGEILKLEEEVSSRVCYENVLVTSLAGEAAPTDSDSGVVRLSFFMDGIAKEYWLEGQTLPQAYEMVLADVTVHGGKISQVDLKQESIGGKVLAVKEDVIEIQGYGEVPRAEHLKVYRTYGGPAMQEETEIRLGSDAQRFVVAEGKICGVLTERAFEARNIRVLLKTEGYRSMFHRQVDLTCDRPFQVSAGERTDYYQAGQTVSWQPGDACFAEGRVTVTPEEGGQLTVLSLERASGTPAYAGTLELVPAEEGIVLINEVLLEEYLTQVLPSEMPESYGLEALKAQAVCARSYAWRQMEGNAYSDYGAHVDDSTSFQVYHNSAPSELARQAVEETYGQVLTWDGHVVTAYYFSTSCGHTTDGAVWGGEAEALPYLKGRWMQENPPGRENPEQGQDRPEQGVSAPGEPDLTQEEAFRAFLADQNPSAYEAGFPWYRWQVSVSLEELGDRIRAYVSAPGMDRSKTLEVRQADGSFQPAGSAELGELQKMEVIERGEGGIADVLEVTGSEAVIRIRHQNAIRTALGSPDDCYQRNGDTVVGRGELLPSAYFFLEPQMTQDAVSGYTIFGGGSGHGAGMSQNAACYLGRIGKTYDEILEAFYTDCVLARLY